MLIFTLKYFANVINTYDFYLFFVYLCLIYALRWDPSMMFFSLSLSPYSNREKGTLMFFAPIFFLLSRSVLVKKIRTTASGSSGICCSSSLTTGCSVKNTTDILKKKEEGEDEICFLSRSLARTFFREKNNIKQTD